MDRVVQYCNFEIKSPTAKTWADRILFGILNDSHLTVTDQYPNAKSTPPKMAVLRLTGGGYARDLAESLQERAKKCPAPPFEIILMTQGTAKEMAKQLTVKGYRTIGSPLGSDLDMDQLSMFPVLLIVVDKLGIGDRLPSTCAFYDVRARYDRDDISFKSTFLQAIGRCAGHKPHKAKILLSGSRSPYEDILFKKSHALLTTASRPAPNHPQHTSSQFPLYKEAEEYSLMLDAEPQIGKTGALLSLMEILYKERIQGSRVQPPTSLAPVLPSQPLPSPESKIKCLTREFRDKINNNGWEKYVEYVTRIDSNDSRSLWNKYHDALEAVDHTNTNSTVLQRISSYVDSLENMPEVVWIADCGCGRSGLVAQLRHATNYPELTFQISVVGTDVSEDIKQLEKVNDKYQNAGFTARVGDMAQDSDIHFHIILYNHSLFENNITRHIQWASQHLGQGGRLIIIDVVSRFPENFVEAVKGFGFALMVFGRVEVPPHFALYQFRKSGDVSQEQWVVWLLDG